MVRPVFKNMVDIAKSDIQRDPITLTDPRMEVSVVVEATLDILYNHEIVSFGNDMEYCCVVDFARKWDMASVLKTISIQLRLHSISPENGNRPLRLLRIAIALGETEPIATIIRSSCGKTWPAASGRVEKQQGENLPYRPPSLPKPTLSDGTRGFLKGAPIFDLGGWPYAKFADLPTPLVWALLRAGTTLDQAHVTRTSTTLATEVKKLMDMMCELPIWRLSSCRVSCLPFTDPKETATSGAGGGKAAA